MVVYKITNKINGKVYIGSTVNYERRMKEHKRLGFGSLKVSDFDTINEKTGRKHIGSLRQHSGLYLDMRLAENGIVDFDFEIMAECSTKEEMLELENQYILEYWDNSYNDLYTDRDKKVHSQYSKMGSKQWGMYKKLEKEITTF